MKKNNWKHYILNEKVLIIALIIVAILFSTFFRMYPSTLPVTRQWAEDSYYNQIRGTIGQQVSQQYPNLPTEQRNQYIEEQLQEVLKTQEGQLQGQIEQTAAYFKGQMQNEEGNTYLLAIDPYVWYSEARNIETYGHLGNEEIDGRLSFSLRNGREPKWEDFTLHPYLIVITHKIVSVFNSNFSLQRAAFYMPILIIALAIIPAFFLGRKIGGNVAGFIAAMIIALNTALLGRTPAGFADTDAYLILFPLLIVWFFVEAMTTKNLKYKIYWTGGAIAASVMFKYIWPRWSHIATVLLAVAGIYFLVNIFNDSKKYRKNFKKALFNTPSGKTTIVVATFLVGVVLFIGIIGTLVSSQTFFESAYRPIKGIFILPLNALGTKNVAQADIWPNVLTTVAELNAGSWNQIFGSLGGKIFFIIGVLGVILTFFLKNEDDRLETRYGSLLAIWFFGLTIAGLISGRFIALLAAPFAIAFGAAFGITWTRGSELVKTYMQIPKWIVHVALIVIILAIFIVPVQRAHAVSLSEVPSMNDGWYNSLITIQKDTEDGIITSWWDFGHWFVNIAQRRVTFDGGDQGKRIYWAGRSLAINNLEQNKNILRMLNCGQNKGYDRILEYTNNNYLSTTLINTIVNQNSTTARTTLLEGGLTETQANKVLEKTHCANYLDQYYIVSEDMVGKAGVWAHFGNWNFTKAYVYNTAIKNDLTTAVQKIQEQTGMDENTASEMYFEATSLRNAREVDTWISPWPGYVTPRVKACTETNTTITCSIGAGLGSQQGQQVVLNRVFIPKDNIENSTVEITTVVNGRQAGANMAKPVRVSINGEKDFEVHDIEGATFPYEVVVENTTGSYRAIVADPLIARSAFTKLFFFDGIFMDGYEKLSDVKTFNGQRVIVYKVDLT